MTAEISAVPSVGVAPDSLSMDGGWPEPSAASPSTYLLHQRFRYDYESPVRHLRHRLMVVPRAVHGDQRRFDHRLSVTGAPALVSVGSDGFANFVIDVRAAIVDELIEFETWSLVRSGGERGSKKVFANPDGTRTVQLDQAPVRHLDPATGKWADIDLRLVAGADGKLGAASAPKGSARLSTNAKGDVATVDIPAGTISLRHPDAASSAAATAGQTTTYAKALPGGRDLASAARPDGLEETVTLPKPLRAGPTSTSWGSPPASTPARADRVWSSSTPPASSWPPSPTAWPMTPRSPSAVPPHWCR
ncbi:MAG: transglutaminase N-terminal domain-containing protein [Acidimicrobiales bacterium]